MANVDPALEQQVLDAPRPQREPHVHNDDLADTAGDELKLIIALGLICGSFDRGSEDLVVLTKPTERLTCCLRHRQAQRSKRCSCSAIYMHAPISTLSNSTAPCAASPVILTGLCSRGRNCASPQEPKEDGAGQMKGGTLRSPVMACSLPRVSPTCCHRSNAGPAAFGISVTFSRGLPPADERTFLATLIAEATNLWLSRIV